MLYYYIHAMDYEEIIAEKDAKYAQLEQKFALYIDRSDMKIQELEWRLDQMLRMMYGKKSEAFKPAPYTGPNLFSHMEEPQEQLAPQVKQVPTKTITYQRKKNENYNGRRLLDHLPAGIKKIQEEIPACQTVHAKYIGEVISERLGFNPDAFNIRQITRKKYVELTGEIKIGSLPEQAIDKCEADSSLLALIITSKYVDHLPEYRQQKIFAGQGVNITPSTMNSWLQSIGRFVTPIVEEIKKQILALGYVQMDESTIQVMQKDKTHKGYMWVINSPSSGMSYFEYHPGRDQSKPKGMLGDFAGALQSDGYNVFEMIDGLNKQIVHYCCMAHARRKFTEAINNDKQKADTILLEMQKHYQIEAYCRDNQLDHHHRKKKRIEQAIPILENLRIILDNYPLTAIPKSPIGKALEYIIVRWHKLIAYAYTGDIEIDNNLVENAIRPLALGRKNYLFAGSDDAAMNIVKFYSLFSSCKAFSINPYDYLKWVLDEFSKSTINQVTSFTPLAYLQLTKV